jgi:hypothetical protein
MKAIVTPGLPLTLLDRPDSAGIPIGTTDEGDMINISPSVVGGDWFVTPKGKRNGFIKGRSRFQILKPIIMASNGLALAEPRQGTEVTIQCRAGETLYLIEKVPGDGGNWLHVHNGIIRDGFLPPNVSVTDGAIRANVRRANADLLYGGLFVAGGLLVTAGSYAWASENGGWYLFSGGPILFGLYKLYRGVTGRPKAPGRRDRARELTADEFA